MLLIGFKTFKQVKNTIDKLGVDTTNFYTLCEYQNGFNYYNDKGTFYIDTENNCFGTLECSGEGKPTILFNKYKYE